MGKALIKAASDGEETANKFNVVFATVADDAEEAADRIQDEFKLSDETVQNFLSGVGDITSGLGATSEEALKAAEDITTLGLDINSFANLSGGAEQAVKALTSLFTGEREAAKALGIVINDTNLKAYAEGMGKVFKELTPLEKGFLSLELATKQSTLAIGDFARSSDSYANTAKAATEATKDLKAALGVSLLPAATEGVAIFTKLAQKMAEVVKEHNELQDIIERRDKGIKTAQDSLTIAKRQLEIVRKEREGLKEKIRLIDDAANRESRLFQIRVDELRMEDIRIQDIISLYASEVHAIKQVENAEKARLAQTQKLLDLELEASSVLDGRRKARLTDEEVLLESLNAQIDKWAEFREIAGVQELLNDLVRERTELLKEEEEVLEESKTTHADMLAEAMFDLREYGRVSEEVTEKARLDWENLATIGLGSMTTGFQDIGEALVKGKLGIADFGKLFLNSISSVLQGLGAELAALAAVQLLLGNVPGAVGGAAASAAAYTASGVVSGLAGSFAEGGSFTTNGPTPIMVGDNIGGREEVTVRPVSSKGANERSGSGEQMILNIDGQQFLGWVQSKLDSGNLRVPRRIIA
jgi:hypothetical protein